MGAEINIAGARYWKYHERGNVRGGARSGEGWCAVAGGRMEAFVRVLDLVVYLNSKIGKQQKTRE
jgi:hypothetical protein